MPNKDRRTEAGLRSAQYPTSGSMMVTYIDTKKRSRLARVLGPGTTSGVKLYVESTGQTLDNVVKATAANSTNAYRSYL